ncbi:MAG: ATP-binding protein [Acidobacteriota bacterium]
MLVPAGECNQCRGTGFHVREVHGYLRASPCACQTSEHTTHLVRAAQIPARYQHCDLDNYEVSEPSKLAAKKCAREFAEGFPGREGDVGLLFVGGPGVGKTHLAVGILRFLILKKGIMGLFVDFRDLLKEIRETFAHSSNLSASQILRPTLQSEVLVLDDLGASKPTEWVLDTLSHIINRRYNDQKCTIFTTNFADRPPLEEAGTSLEAETLSERLGLSLWSRLGQMCKLVEITGLDHRRHIAKADPWT